MVQVYYTSYDEIQLKNVHYRWKYCLQGALRENILMFLLNKENIYIHYIYNIYTFPGYSKTEYYLFRIFLQLYTKKHY